VTVPCQRTIQSRVDKH